MHYAKTKKKILRNTNTKLSNHSSAKCCQDNKERVQKVGRERYQSLPKNKEEKKQQYGCERYENRPKGWLSTEKIITKLEKMPHYD